jgi:hypothetical protein
VAVTAQNVRSLSLSGEFDSLVDAQIEPRITLAESLVNRDVWDTSATGGRDLGDDGVAHLAAHFLALDQGATMGAAGPVMAESAGGMSRQYGFAVRQNSVTLDESLLLRTTYGQRFLMLRKSLPIMPLVANTSGGGLYRG